MSDEPLQVIAGAPDRPLIIGDIAIDCYVLENETRVITQAGFLGALGRSPKPPAHSRTQFDNLPFFLRPGRLQPFISQELTNSTTPIKFSIPRGGPQAIGYDARLLPQVCEVYLRAREAGVLLPSQQHIAERAEILIRGLATVGIIGLVDEATGYQEIRARNALAEILEKFLEKELQPWTRTFPYEFYKEIFRLKGWPGPDGGQRPQIIGHYTNDFVYKRLAPGVLDELKLRNPKLPSGHRGNKHHQWFTPDFGHPKLKEHLAAVTALMRASANWGQFTRNIQRAFPILAYQPDMFEDAN